MNNSETQEVTSWEPQTKCFISNFDLSRSLFCQLGEQVEETESCEMEALSTGSNQVQISKRQKLNMQKSYRDGGWEFEQLQLVFLATGHR